MSLLMLFHVISYRCCIRRRLSWTHCRQPFLRPCGSYWWFPDRIGCQVIGAGCGRNICDSLAASTWKTYKTAQADYLAFCRSVQTSLLPASEDLLILYAAQLSTRLLHSSIRSYLSAVRNLHIMHGCGDSMAGRLKFEQFMKGIKRINPSSSDRRLPVLPFILTKVCQVLERNPHDKDNIMFWAACCLGFFCHSAIRGVQDPFSHELWPF